MKYLSLILCVLFFLSCKNKTISNLDDKKLRSVFSKVEINHLLEDSTLNVRAIAYEGNILRCATSDGRVFENNARYPDSISEVYLDFKNDLSLNGKNNFRSIAVVKAQDSKNTYFNLALTIANPAKLYKHGKLVYKEAHPNVFYDAMVFWNDKEGIAIGDPTDDCMSVIITRDSGNTWTKITCDKLPRALDGEAAFAASDTNISIVGNHTWVATGGKASRVLYSPDKGKTWEVFNTPIIQGKETTGMYSIDFYDALNGFAIGGDYTKPDANSANKISTNDGGKTWQLVAENKNPGYRSCVQYVPNSHARQLVTVGFKGIDYSNDSGETWQHLSDEGYCTIRFINDSTAYAAGNGKVSKLNFK